MLRRIIQIDQERCNGCGLCVKACHEGAIGLVDGKATLLRDDYCDGLGDCLPSCPAEAISFVEREAAAYDEKAVLAAKRKGTLQNFPIQLKLAPVSAPYYNEAELLIAADCTAFASSSFHQDHIRGRVTLIGCPKLDGVDYTEKLTEIFTQNRIKSIQVIRMTVPCCGGLPFWVNAAIENSEKNIPVQVITLSPEGIVQ